MVSFRESGDSGDHHTDGNNVYEKEQKRRKDLSWSAEMSRWCRILQWWRAIPSCKVVEIGSSSGLHVDISFCGHVSELKLGRKSHKILLW